MNTKFLKQKKSLIIVLVFFAITLSISGCSEFFGESENIKVYKPVYLSYSELRNSVKNTNISQITEAGKIYTKDHYIFIHEKDKGIHVIDNSDPSDPEHKTFWHIRGCEDIAIRGSILYADSYTDLVIADISDYNNIRETNRMTNIFDYPSENIWNLQTNNDYDISYESVDTSKGIVIGYKYSHTETVQYRTGIMETDSAYDGSSGNSSSSDGSGGSMARFAIISDYLYIVTDQKMLLFNISTPQTITPHARVNMSWGIETIFPYNDLLFIGSETGMHIYNNATPGSPEKLSTFEHVRSYDPVVVQSNTAYVTIRESEWEWGENKLFIIDISDPASPKELKEIPMWKPAGLAIDGKNLFICDGSAGLKYYHVTNRSDLTNIQTQSGIEPFDVILSGKTAKVVTKDSIIQYDYSSETNLVLISEFALEN